MDHLQYLIDNKISFTEINEAQRVLDAFPDHDISITVEDPSLPKLVATAEFLLKRYEEEPNKDKNISHLASTIVLFCLSGMLVERIRREKEAEK